MQQALALALRLSPLSHLEIQRIPELLEHGGWDTLQTVSTTESEWRSNGQTTFARGPAMPRHCSC